MLTGRKKIVSYLEAAFSKRMPWRKYYHACAYRFILRSLEKKSERAWAETLYDRLSALTKIDIPHLAQLEQGEKEAIVDAADKTIANVFNLLGSGDVKLNPVAWEADFVSGHKWPAGTYYRKYKQIDLTNRADVKIPRELSRGHFLLHLALAYQFTQDSKYADKLVELVTDWIDKNPLMYSINWGCAMDVGIRAMNWIWALSLLEGYEIDTKHESKIKTSLYLHGWFIYRNLEGTLFDYNNNHYFSDITSLLHLGLLFRNDKEGGLWFDFALREFYREFRLQILPCGMSFEGSTNYNRLMLELIIPTVVMLKRDGNRIPSDIESRLRSMFDIVCNTTMPDGEMPIVGDQDNGRGLPLGVEDINDYTYIPAIGCAYFQQHCWGPAHYNVYAAVFGELGKEEFDNLPDQTKAQRSVLYYDAGLAVLRDNENYCLFNVDNQGFYMDDSLGSGHSHSDWLSFVLALGGETFIVDPGSYVYSSNPEERNRFRSTSMHNTIVVDGKSQSDIPEKELWKLPRIGRTSIDNWESGFDYDKICVSHNAYTTPEASVQHRRILELSKKDGIFTIKDSISCNSGHSINCFLHFAPDVETKIESNTIILDKHGVKAEIKVSSNQETKISLVSDVVSRGYGETSCATVVCLSADIENDYLLMTEFKRVK